MNSTQAALDLNTTLDTAGAPRSLADAAVSGGKAPVMTPADDVRRRHKDQDFESLTLEEKQWTMLDQALNPEM